MGANRAACIPFCCTYVLSPTTFRTFSIRQWWAGFQASFLQGTVHISHLFLFTPATTCTATKSLHCKKYLACTASTTVDQLPYATNDQINDTPHSEVHTPQRSPLHICIVLRSSCIWYIAAAAPAGPLLADDSEIAAGDTAHM
jgi:hypothetical protein